MAWNSFFIPVDIVGPVLTRWTRFWSKMMVLTQNGMKLIVFSGWHCLTRIDSMNSVLTENDGFDPKQPETHFYPSQRGLTRIDPVDSVLIENDGFDQKRTENSFFTLVDMVWPVLTRWTRFWSKMMILTWNGLKTHILPWSTWFDLYWPGGIGFYGKMRLTREKYIFEF